MASIYPFRAFRYSQTAGDLNHLVTQPYDKISPSMQAKYLAASPYNVVRIILGERFPTDTDTDNVYSRAASYLKEWTSSGILEQDREPGLYAYFQEFTVPDTGERLVRKGFIGLGAVEDYSAGIVHRHEKTLAGPKKDRMELLERTRAHFGQIFMLYPDRERQVDSILDRIAATIEPDAVVEDEYEARHSLWRVADPGAIAEIQRLMSDKKLLIADGHHRYETAVAFSKAHPELEDAKRVMITFVNMYSDGLRILPTHRVLSNLRRFSPEQLVNKLRGRFQVAPVDSTEALHQRLTEPHPAKLRIGLALQGDPSLFVIEKERARRDLDIRILHEAILAGMLGIDEESVREQRNLTYVRGLIPAVEAVQSGEAQAAFIMEPVSVEQVGEISFGGGVMPQKSTDFYPKLLSGLTIYYLQS
jgi:uncharacterized protein (DUF1015 family)